jgi:hypothetical protein
MTKMPLGTKTTQNDSDAILKWIFNRELKQELYKQIKRLRDKF